jgi:hypothetical protein
MKPSALLLALLLPFASANANASAAAAVDRLAAPASARPAARALSETDKINALIAGIEHLPGAVFIRNGSEYTGDRAAAHMRLKWHNAGRRIKTADDFIHYCASASSMSGKKYRIRFADGHSVDSAQYFQQQLKLIEARPASGVAKTR